MATIFFIANTPANREELFIDLYKNAFPAASKYVRKMGGSFDDAKDVFHDALVIYYEKIVAGGKPANTTDVAYLLGINRHLWLKKCRGGNKLQPMDDRLNDFADLLVKNSIKYVHRYLALYSNKFTIKNRN